MNVNISKTTKGDRLRSRWIGEHAAIGVKDAHAPVVARMSESLTMAYDYLVSSGEIVAGSRISLVLAVSGGSDSHAMLHCLGRIFDREKMGIVVSHLDHGLRPDSRKEMEFVKEICDSYGVPCLCRCVSPPPKEARENVEVWARGERYKFFEQCRQETSSNLIATAHQMDDLAETALFRILSGRMSSDTRAIARLCTTRRLLRPLLDVTRKEIRDYLLSFGLAWSEDSSNLDTSRTRSRIRHQLLPALCENYNPNLKQNLAEFAQRIGSDETYLWGEAAKIESVAQIINAERLCEIPETLRWRVLKLRIQKHVGDEGAKLGYSAIKRLLERILENEAWERSFDLPHGIVAVVNRKRGVSFRARKKPA